MSSKGRSCGCKGSGSRKSRERFYNSQDFMVNCFKVLPCFKKYRHDWWVCPYAHEGETAKRRDPKKFKYVGVACPDAKQGKTCPRGDDCPCTHNVFEYWLHPTRFRTAFCGRGIHCTRPFCFFAHSLSEMRKPSLDDLLPVIQGDSLFNDEMLKRALEEHKRDVARLGGKDTCSELLDMSFLQMPQNRINPFKDTSGPVPYNLSPRHMIHNGSLNGISSGGLPSPSSQELQHAPSPRDMDNRIPNMQSPREVLGYMNAVLSRADPRDHSPQTMHYAFPDDSLGIQAVRDLSPSMLQGNGHSLMRNSRSPSNMGSPLHRGLVGGPPGLVPSPRSLRPDLEKLQLVDQSILPSLLHSTSGFTSDVMSPLMGRTEDLSPVRSHSSYPAALSPTVGSPHMDTSFQETVVSRPRQRQTAGVYEGRHRGGNHSSEKSSQKNWLNANLRNVTKSSRSLSPGSIMPLEIPSSPETNHALESPHKPVSPHTPIARMATLDSVQSMISMNSMQSELCRMSSARVNGSDAPKKIIPSANGGMEDGCDIPESLQAVLRSLVKEDEGMLEQDFRIGLNRPFSSISKLW